MTDRYLSIKELAIKLCYSPSHIRQRVVTLPHFPEAIHITEKAEPRWKESEVDRFMQEVRR